MLEWEGKLYFVFPKLKSTDGVYLCEHVCSVQVIRVLISKATADSIQNCLMSLLLGKATQAFVEDFSSSQRLLVEIFFLSMQSHMLEDST